MQYCKQKVIKRVENSWDSENYKHKKMTSACLYLACASPICTQTYIQHDKHVSGVAKDEYVGVVPQLLAACCK